MYLNMQMVLLAEVEIYIKVVVNNLGDIRMYT